MVFVDLSTIENCTPTVRFSSAYDSPKIEKPTELEPDIGGSDEDFYLIIYLKKALSHFQKVFILFFKFIFVDR